MYGHTGCVFSHFYKCTIFHDCLDNEALLTLLHSERPKLYRVLALLSATVKLRSPLEQ